MGLAFRTEPEKFAVFWPPNGLLLGALLVSDRRYWRGLVLVAALACLLVNWLEGIPPAVCLGFAAVNVAEPCLTAGLWRRWRGASAPLGTTRDVFSLYAVAVATCAAAALPGSAVVVFGLGAPDFGSVWLTFWLADCMGAVLVTPVLVGWADVARARPGAVSVARGVEAAGLTATAAAVSLLIFAAPAGGPNLPGYPFPIFPVILWAALRFGTPGTTATVLLVALVAMWNTGRGRGPFADPSVPAAHRLIVAQLFLVVLSVGNLVLAVSLGERERALAALRESEERYRQVTDTIEEVFWVVTPDLGRVVYLSPAYDAIWGRPRAGVYDNPGSLLDGIHPDDRGRVLESYRARVGEPHDHEFRVVRPDGTVRWVSARAFPLRDDHGRVCRVIGVTRDVTDRREVEAAKAELIEQLRRALAEVKTLRGLIPICAWCKKMRDDGGFWQSLEHYLRTHTEGDFTHGICPDCLASQLTDAADLARPGEGR
ncbi:MAG: hypothetical protein C0501_02090 [Isosphaera sp.]|nr:hypothetical protein [Isosphaera sp.]